MALVTKMKTANKNYLTFLPEEIILPKTSEKIILDFYKDTDYESFYEMLKYAVEEGIHYPRETIDKIQFENYYLLCDVFVVRDASNKDALGAFYLKSNFPGRSSHICNGGFVVNKNHRKKGIGEVLYKKYLLVAKKMGYEASLFSSVYESNKGSVRICRKLGFQEIGKIPKAGKMKGLGYVDALLFYYDLTSLDDSNL